MAVARERVGAADLVRLPGGVPGRVLELRLGLGGAPPLSVEETARAMRIHPDFIRAMEAAAFDALGGWGPGLPDAA